MKQLGIALISIDDPVTDDSAVGMLARNMLAAINQFFSDSLSERTRYRMQAAVKSGRFPWPAPTGHVNKGKKLHPDPVRSPLVREVFQLIASGRCVTADAVRKVVTAMELTAKGGRAVSKQTFARMIATPANTVLFEMVWRFVVSLGNVGVPDGI